MPVVQVIFFPVSVFKGQTSFAMTESHYKNNKGDCAKYATEADGAIMTEDLRHGDLQHVSPELHIVQTNKNRWKRSEDAKLKVCVCLCVLLLHEAV